MTGRVVRVRIGRWDGRPRPEAAGPALLVGGTAGTDLVTARPSQPWLSPVPPRRTADVGLGEPVLAVRRPGGPPGAVGRPIGTRWTGDSAGEAGSRSTDEHVAVDADRCHQADRLACADVLYAGRPREAGEAMAQARQLTMRHPGCRMAACAVAGGGWAVSDGRYRCVLIVQGTEDGDRMAGRRRLLLPSCLHGWLVAGHPLRDLRWVAAVGAYG